MIAEVEVAGGMKKELSSDKFFNISKLAWLPDKSGLVMTARKNHGENNQLWRVAYPSLEISQITEGLISYLDLSLASGADKAVASQATLIFDLWVGTSREPRNLKKITQATDMFCWTPDGRIVYASTANGNEDLWIMEPGGAQQRQLTADPAVDSRPAVTSDNRHILFMSNRTGALQVWCMNIDGSNQTELTDGGGKDSLAVSPDGKWVLYNTTDDWHLWKVSIDGGEPLRLTEYVASYASVSPDGRMIACVGRDESKREILILPFKGGQPLKRFDFAGWSSRLQWTEDGKALIYAAQRGGTTHIMRQPLDGGPPGEIVGLDEEVLFDFGYSSDRQFFAVTRGAWQHDIVLISGLNQY